jgi:cob(I)alamin adenosyltransferase
LARIYTRTGDRGETGLFGGTRVSKASPRVEAYGNVDELNSVLGLTRAISHDEEISSLLETLQRGLFTLGSDLATPAKQTRDVPRISKDMILSLENTIDKFETTLPPLKVFILPSGGQTGALLHFARSVARRAERSMVALNKNEALGENLIPYINRVSDLLFVMARVANQREGWSEIEWHEPKS